MNAILRLVVAFILQAAFAAEAGAVEPLDPELRQPAIVHGDLVTLGDLFENAGSAAGAAVFRSPALGDEGAVTAARVVVAAREQGLYWTNPEGIDKVVVRRPSRTVSLDAISDLVRNRAADDLDAASPNDIEVSLSKGVKPIEVEATIEQPAVIRRFDLQRGGGFRVVIGIEGRDEVQDRVYSGRATEMIELPVLARTVERDDVLTDEDVRLLRMPKERAGAGYIETMQEAVGMAATRTLSEGRSLRSGDIARPTLVRKNTLVSIVYEAPGLLLKSQGRALGDAAKDEVVSVENGQSRRILQAVVREHGVVVVTAASHASASAEPAQTSSQHLVR